MSTSQAQVARLLALVPYLQSRPGVAIVEVASTFNISAKQVMADLKVLWMCGLPGGLPDDLIEIDMDAAQGEGVVHLSNADYLTRPLRFTRDEAVSLVVALQAISEMAAGSMRQAAESAAAKLSGVTGQDDPVWLAINTGDEELREHLLAAIGKAERVQLTYDGAARGETTQPLVDPAEIQMRDSVAYLQAWSLDRAAWRTYRLDRIVEVRHTGQAAEAHGPVPELPEGWFDGSDGEVVLDLTADAAWVAEYFPIRSLEELGLDPQPHAGHLRARFAVADPRWLESLLLRLGDQATVVAPAEARLSAVVAAREALELTELVCGNLMD